MASEEQLRGEFPGVFAALDANVHGLRPDLWEAAKADMIQELQWRTDPTRHALDSEALSQAQREQAAALVMDAASNPSAPIENLISTFSELWAIADFKRNGDMRLDLEQLTERLKGIVERMETTQDATEQNVGKMALLLGELSSQMSTPGQSAPPPDSVDLPPPPGMPKMPLALSSDERHRLAKRFRSWTTAARTQLNAAVQSDFASRLNSSDSPATRCAKKREAYAAFVGKPGTRKHRENVKKLQEVTKLPAKCLPGRKELSPLQELLLGGLEALCGEAAETWFEGLGDGNVLRGCVSGLGATDFVEFLDNLSPNLRKARAVLYIAQRQANPGGSIVVNKSGEAGPGGCKGPNFTGAPGRHAACRVARHYGHWLDEHAAHARTTGCPLTPAEARIDVCAIFERPRARSPLEHERRRPRPTYRARVPLLQRGTRPRTTSK